MSSCWNYILFCIFLGMMPLLASAQEKKQTPDPESDESEEEFDSLEDSDFPDLVGVDEKGELVDEFTFLEESDVVESAAKHRQYIGMSPSAITVITRDDIESSGATNIPDLLRLVPGMGVMVDTPFFTALSSRVYWSNENYFILVLVDGREMNLELMGQPYWGLIPTMDDIERIEVIRGPGSALYGANALGGVISITTRAVPQKTSALGLVMGGESGLMRATFRASSRIGDWGFSLSGTGNLQAEFDDPKSLSSQSFLTRALAEYNWSELKSFTIDLSFSGASGTYPIAQGNVDGRAMVGAIRLAYQSEDIHSQLYYTWVPVDYDLETAIVLSGIHVADFSPGTFDGHMLTGKFQWSLPRFLNPLLMIVGIEGGTSFLSSDEMLDEETFADRNSSRYHQLGIRKWEGRVGVFLHTELTVADWMTATAGLRYDFNTQTQSFLSPRLATVFNPLHGQFFRAGVALSFRKPCFLESNAHLVALFPEGSPITGPQQEKFQEFMARTIGNGNLDNEKMLSFETGYLGKFLEDRLDVSLELFYNLYYDNIVTQVRLVSGGAELPDLEKSAIRFENIDPDMHIFGSELSVQWNPNEFIGLLFNWSYREVMDVSEKGRISSDLCPQNLFAIGGHFRTTTGLIGSLYLFSRSEHKGLATGPSGEQIIKQMNQVFLILGKVGMAWRTNSEFNLESGIKIFLPLSPFEGSLFKFYEDAGGMTVDGRKYGSDELGRMVTVYLQGYF